MTAGRVVLNGIEFPCFPFKNLVKTMSGYFAGGGNFNADGYPTDNTFTSAGGLMHLPSNYYGRYRLVWSGAMRKDAGGLPVTVYSGGANFSSGNFTGTDGNVEFDFSVVVTGAADNGSGAIRLTTPAINSVSPANCRVANVGGVPGATGDWSYTRISSTQIDLIGSIFSGSYTSGGTITFQPSSYNFLFKNAGTFSNFSNLILCRSSAPYTGDLAAIQGGVVSDQFNDDFIALISNLNPYAFRMMDAAGINNSMISRTAYMTPVSAMTYTGVRFPPSIQVGTISGTETYTCGAATDTPGSYTDGEVEQGTITTAPTVFTVTGAAAGASNGVGGNYIRIATASTAALSNGQRIAMVGYGNNVQATGRGIWTITVIDGTHFDLINNAGGTPSAFSVTYSSGGKFSTCTINIGSRGAKLFAGIYGGTPDTAGGIANGAQITLVYDALQDCVLSTTGGLVGAYPVATRVALCNKLNVHYWHNFPHLYDNASCAAETAYISANLNAGLKCYFEYSNEVWNSGFQQFQVAMQRGWCFGWPDANNEPNSGYTALRHRQIMEQVTTSWGGRSGLHRVLPTQAASAANSGVVKYLYNGFDLNGTNFPRYGSLIGVNYDTAPNRPSDFTDDLSYAPYYNGAIIELGGAGRSLASYSAGDISGLTGAADDYASGDLTRIQSALNWIDNDVRSGTRNGVGGSQTLAFLNSNYYPGFQTAAAAYTPAKGIICYEGGFQGGNTLAQSECTTLGISTSYGGTGNNPFFSGGTIWNLMVAYKNSAQFRNTVLKQFADQLAISPNIIPAWYTLGDNGATVQQDPWSMLPIDINSTPFQSYDACRLLNNGLSRLVVRN